jgi:hypothetical protein
MKPTHWLLPVAAAACFLASPAAAQQVELRGRGDVGHDVLLRDLIARGDYVLIARDTLIGRNDTVPGTALVLGARLRLEGVVTGDLVIVDANVFLRPSARVLGSIRNVGGGLYPSELATIEGATFSDPHAPYIVRELDDGTLVIQGLTRRSALVLPGIFGLGLPAYDRVDGLTLSWGAEYLTPRIGYIEPAVRGRVDYRSQRGALTGGAELGLPRRGTELAFGAERTTLTNEGWIRSTPDNTVSFLLLSKDYRDYYEADRGYAELRRTLETGPRTTTVFLRSQLEQARTLPAGSPWTVLGTPRSDNMVIDDGRIASVLGGGSMEWRHPLHLVRLTATAEAAGAVLRGQHSFARFEITADWALAALHDHTLRIQPHFRGPLPGTESLPRQRWSFVGGSGTIYTRSFAEFRGDRVAFLETLYSIPVPLSIRFLGAPDLDLLHLAGMAWSAGESPPFLQNLGARVRFALVNVRVLTDPSSPADVDVSVGFNLPRRSYPWQER